jgi:hypothetical protein
MQGTWERHDGGNGVPGIIGVRSCPAPRGHEPGQELILGQLADAGIRQVGDIAESPVPSPRRQDVDQGSDVAIFRGLALRQVARSRRSSGSAGPRPPGLRRPCTRCRCSRCRGRDRGRRRGAQRSHDGQWKVCTRNGASREPSRASSTHSRNPGSRSASHKRTPAWRNPVRASRSD